MTALSQAPVPQGGQQAEATHPTTVGCHPTTASPTARLLPESPHPDQEPTLSGQQNVLGNRSDALFGTASAAWPGPAVSVLCQVRPPKAPAWWVSKARTEPQASPQSECPRKAGRCSQHCWLRGRRSPGKLLSVSACHSLRRRGASGKVRVHPGLGTTAGHAGPEDAPHPRQQLPRPKPHSCAPADASQGSPRSRWPAGSGRRVVKTTRGA